MTLYMYDDIRAKYYYVPSITIFCFCKFLACVIIFLCFNFCFI